ncbi:unnamed protein product [Rotaria magnacalcarata]|uniref:Thioredoxin domain-containing protein n=3 Tax=Rotaria magnacalcarata TaxID=392030 RepID=A0A819J2C5_9BILA|nr:unnamed protein product [Rotaria magnacalcarata]CAF1684242.1 unnamed protein product [Rotaria magnacalcarata]CAF1944420.1 unnamed protein product [Rotaria magnacalcarata]CAF1996675.1 unnamed protein product [Rotaria magnacalcarata]CAF2251565.1 unnamed protein product [Rotaria magnacalcarata]
MPLFILSKEHDFNEIILERRLNTILFTVCWSLGSKIILPTIIDLAYEKNLAHVNFYRIDIDENNIELAQRLNIATIPTIQWYFQGYKLDESIGIDIEQFTDKTRHLAKIYKRKTIEEPSTSNEYTEKKSS